MTIPTPANPDPVEPDHPDRLSPLRELQLVEAYKAGDSEAIRELLESYQRRIYSVCYRMLNHREHARDLTQDSIVKVIEGLETFDGRSSLSTWIIRVTMNCCLSWLRKQKLRRHESLDVSAGNTDQPRGDLLAAGEELSPEKRIEQSQQRKLLIQAMQSLDPATRALLVLRDVQGLEYQQISEVMGIALGTVKSRLFRARATLRKELETKSETHHGEIHHGGTRKTTEKDTKRRK